MMSGPHLQPVAGGAPVALDRDRLTVGRLPGNDVQLDDPMVSRNHARLERQGTTVVVHDLSSANGTFVNDRRVNGSAPLNEGDSVRFGGTTFTLRGTPAAETQLFPASPQAGGPPGVPPAPPGASAPPEGYAGQLPGNQPPVPSSVGYPQPPTYPTPAPGYVPQGQPPVAPPLAPAALEPPGEPPIVLTRPQVVFGRDPACDFVFADPAVAPRHAVIGQQGNDYFLIDAGSQTGTFVNGQRLTAPRALQPGDQIYVGRTMFVFRRLPPTAQSGHGYVGEFPGPR